MLLTTVVAASAEIAATRSRKAKVETIAGLLRQTSADEVAVVAAWIGGGLRQRRTGLGWRSMTTMPDPAEVPTLTVREVDDAFETMSRLSGPGSQTTRQAASDVLFGRATVDEQGWLRGVVTGAVRQGALDALVQEGVAAATALPLGAVRRAAMLAGSTPAIVETAFTEGESGLARLGLQVGRPVLPMLASSEPDVASAFARVGGLSAAVDHKLDGIRVQAHKRGDQVTLATRTLEDITDRLPEIVAVVRGLPAETAILDGEVMLIGADGRPRPFQETASRTATTGGAATVTAYFFDVLHLDGRDLLDAPLSERSAHLEQLVPESQRVPRVLASSAEEAEEAFRAALTAGQEGVVVKALEAPYAAGRRGAAWVKVKPVHTLDLVVLAVEEGSGRRRGWLSNIHLGARDPETGGFVMLGKTFKGMTDEMLTWQTQRFTELMTERDDWVVRLRPEQVVEVAFDGVQRSSRYPGGVALRFARVVRYRDDKPVEEIDTIETVRSYLSAGPQRG